MFGKKKEDSRSKLSTLAFFLTVLCILVFGVAIFRPEDPFESMGPWLMIYFYLMVHYAMGLISLFICLLANYRSPDYWSNTRKLELLMIAISLILPALLIPLV